MILRATMQNFRRKIAMNKKRPLTIEERNLAQDFIEKVERNIKDAWHILKAGDLRDLYMMLSVISQRVNACREIIALSQLENQRTKIE